MCLNSTHIHTPNHNCPSQHRPPLPQRAHFPSSSSHFFPLSSSVTCHRVPRLLNMLSSLLHTRFLNSTPFALLLQFLHFHFTGSILPQFPPPLHFRDRSSAVPSPLQGVSPASTSVSSSPPLTTPSLPKSSGFGPTRLLLGQRPQAADALFVQIPLLRHPRPPLT